MQVKGGNRHLQLGDTRNSLGRMALSMAAAAAAVLQELELHCYLTSAARRTGLCTTAGHCFRHCPT